MYNFALVYFVVIWIARCNFRQFMKDLFIFWGEEFNLTLHRSNKKKYLRGGGGELSSPM